MPCLKTKTPNSCLSHCKWELGSSLAGTFPLEGCKRSISSWLSFRSLWSLLRFVSQEWAALFAQHRLKQEEQMSSAGRGGVGAPAESCPCRAAGHQWEQLVKAGVTGVFRSWRLKSSAGRNLCRPDECGVLEAETGRVLTLTWVSYLSSVSIGRISVSWPPKESAQRISECP